MRPALMIIFLSLVLASCGFISQNLEDGYQVGDVSEGIKQDYAWYCGPGLLGIRAVARAVLRVAGVPVIDTCKAVDVIVEGNQ